MDRLSVTISDWTGQLARVGIDRRPSTDSVGGRLLDAYGESDRHYHSVRHLTAVLAVVDDLADLADEPDLVRLAAWYHDAIHRPDGPGDDETRSAELARTDLAALSLDAAAVDEVARLVLLTASHDPEPGDRNGAVLCDADLWILGSDESDYDRYTGEVRAEYGDVADDAWRSGRAAVLRCFLERPAIYRTEPGRQREAAARANLERELSRLAR